MVWLKRTALAFGVLLAFWVVAWAAVPPLVKWQAQTRLAQLTGRHVSLGDVSFRPWALELSVRDIEVAAAPAAQPAAEPVLRVGRVRANLAFWPLFRGLPVIQALDIETPSVRVARLADGRYDVDDLIEKFTRPADAPAGQALAFALHDLQLRGGQLRFDDRPVGRVHRVEALTLSLPFLSNLPSQLEVQAEPRLAFKLNGTSFDSGAQSTPFAPGRHTVLKLAMAELDVAPYLGYLPASLPVRLGRGVLSADLGIEFTRPVDGAAASLALRGWVAGRDVALSHRDGAPLLAWRHLRLGLKDVQPLARRLAFDTLRIEGAQVHLARSAAGRLRLLPEAVAAPAAGGRAPSAPAHVAASAPARIAASAPARASSGPARPAAPAPAWRASLSAVELADARVLWNDAATRPAAALQLDGVSLTVRQLQWPMTQPAPVSAVATLRSQAGGAAAAGRLTVDGVASDQAAQLTLSLSDLALEALAPYVAQAVAPRVEGRLSARATMDWSGDTQAPRLQFAFEQATLDALRVQPGRGRGAPDGAALRQLAVADAQLDVAGRSLTLGSVTVAQPSLLLARDAAGQFNVNQWLRSEGAPDARAGGPAPAPPGHTPWKLQVRQLTLDGGRVQLADAHVQRDTREQPLRAELSRLRIGLRDFTWHAGRAVPAAKVQLRAQVGSEATAGETSRPAGTLDWQGQLGAQPLQASGTLRIERFPAHLVAAYFAQALPVALLRAEAGYAGRLTLRQEAGGLSASAAGDVLLGDVHVTTLPDAAHPATLATGADELLSWQSFALKAVSFEMKPGMRARLEVGEAALSDFYSRLVVTEQGRFNLQDLGAPVPARAASGAAPAASASGAAVSASAAAAGPAGLPLDIAIGVTRFNNGRIDFSDHFVRPNYSAALTELNGELGALRSTSREMATLTLRGRAAGTALLDISGQLNPTVRPLALDIKARATDLELAPLSPYAGKYAGYAIERGKLSLDVAYKIDAQGQLEASNRLVLNQLTFGERIESPSATKLPVLLAVALLKDRNGVINVDLPIRGSLNDPQFSVGGIILRLVVNLLGKAITAPFSLLAGGGGGQDLSLVEFRPGTAVIAEAGANTLDKVARALAERPALRMTVTGAAHPAAERDAYQRAVIDSRLLAERRREALRAGGEAGAAIDLNAEDRARLVKALYRQADLPDKPRNALGFAKDIAVAEMEQLLRRHVPVTDEAMRELALQRATAVRDALIAQGLASERLFMASPKLHEPAAGEAAAGWTPKVQLSLSVK